MFSAEIKFLFDGVLFSSNVFTNHILNSLNGYEVTISFLNRYLISKYRECYCFILENNKFTSINAKDEKEYELINILQNAITKNLPFCQEQEPLSEPYLRAIA